MNDLDAEIRARLADMGITPLLGGLIPERAAADLLGYSHAHMRQQAAKGLGVLPFVRRGNRRFYRIADIRAFVSETA